MLKQVSQQKDGLINDRIVLRDHTELILFHSEYCFAIVSLLQQYMHQIPSGVFSSK